MAFVAVFCCALAVFTACQKEPTPPVGEGGDIIGSWYGEVTGKTYALWNYGPVWANSTFNADGTGYTVMYYLYEDILVAMEGDVFTYTTDGGQVTMVQPENKKTITASYTVNDNRLTLKDDAREQTFAKTTDEMAKKFDEWNKTDGVIPVDAPCKHTVFVYGNAGGTMDDVIEGGFWDEIQSSLTDSTNVRVICMYKYGKRAPNVVVRYGDPGDVVWFELNSKTDLTKIKEEGMQSLGFVKEAQELKICNPNTIRFFMEFSSLFCPAEKYTFAIWGHGSGFNPRTDVPGKYDNPSPKHMPMGVIGDEWNAKEELDMYEFREAIKSTGVDRLYTIFFHNCLMGNLESLTEIRDCADYIGASSHILSSNGEVLEGYVHGLMEKGNAEEAAAWMFDEMVPVWQRGYESDSWNGDFKLMRANKLDGVLDAIKRLTTRVIELYPTQKAAINKATSQVYRVSAAEVAPTELRAPFYDMADFGKQVAKETDDAELKAASADLDRAFNEAILSYRDLSFSGQHLEHYTLTVCMVTGETYAAEFPRDSVNLCNFDEGYEMSTFHKHTGWGNFLRMNEQSLLSNPRCGGE